MEPHYYTVNVNWTSGRKGIISSPELDAENGPRLEVATPPQFAEGVPGVWSPEHFYTAAVSSCLMTTFLSIAANSKLEFSHFSCKSSGKLDQVDGKFRMTEVILEPLVKVVNAEDEARALRILQKSEVACLISNSINAKVVMTPRVETADNEAQV